jgi:hypothetical protein
VENIEQLNLANSREVIATAMTSILVSGGASYSFLTGGIQK